MTIRTKIRTISAPVRAANLRHVAVVAALVFAATGFAATASGTTSYTASLGIHGGSRWTLGRSVYVNLRDMTPGVWKQELWSGSCDQPGARVAVLRGLVVPSSGILAKTTAAGAIATGDAAIVLRLRSSAGVVCGAYRSPLVAGSPSPTASAPPSSADLPPCVPTDQDQYVYNPQRLQVINACVTVTGTVDEVRTEADGDLHILLRVDAAYAGYLKPANQGEERGDLVVEPVCVRSVSQSDAVATCAADADPLSLLPTAGMHVWMQGRYVLDTQHGGWAELHPLYRWGQQEGGPGPSPSATLAPTSNATSSPTPSGTAGDPVAAAKAAGATAVCRDGTWSYSAHRSGTCSGHGGVYWWTGNLGPAGPG